MCIVSMDGGLSQIVVDRKRVRSAGLDVNVDPVWRASRPEGQETDVMPLRLVAMGSVVNLEFTGIQLEYHLYMYQKIDSRSKW